MKNGNKLSQIKRYLTQRNKVSLKEFFEMRDKLKVQSIGKGKKFSCTLNDDICQGFKDFYGTLNKKEQP
jgi:hypothetical protein